MQKEALRIRQGCIQFDVVDKPRAHRCQTQTYPVQTILHSVRYLSHSEAEAYKPYVNPVESHKSPSDFLAIGVPPTRFSDYKPYARVVPEEGPRSSGMAILGSNLFRQASWNTFAPPPLGSHEMRQGCIKTHAAETHFYLGGSKMRQNARGVHQNVCRRDPVDIDADV